VKLTALVLKDFRGFSHEETIDLANGKNLLLYGENGSGKSSIFRALVEFFNREKGARPYRDFRNVFLSDSKISMVDGHVTLSMSNGAKYSWGCLGERPWKDEILAKSAREQLTDASNRASLLDYQSLLRTSFGEGNPSNRLFDLAIGVLLSNVSVPVVGGREITIGQLWANVKNTVPQGRERHTQSRRKLINAASKIFSEALQGVLPDVEKTANDLLSYFGDSSLQVKLRFSGVEYDEYQRNFGGKRIDYEVRLNGVVVEEWNDLLNEARLTALALSLYLAGTLLTNTIPPAGADIPFRILVLDDVLIGLDLEHRLPILRIIEERLADFQVLLLTHDRVWFDLAQLAVVDPEKWVNYEMYSRKTNNDLITFDAPVLRPQSGDLRTHYIDLAKIHLGDTNHDYRTAALDTRAALEVKLKSHCSKMKISVAYDLDGRKLTTDDFLDAIEEKLLRDGTRTISLSNLQRVKLFRRGVLNPSAHFHPVSLARSEVEAAIKAVESLEFQKIETDYASLASDLLSRAVLLPHEMVEAAAFIRTSFEVDLRSLLIRLGGSIRYRAHLEKIDLQELWIAGKLSMTSLNPVLALPLISAIEAHSGLLLDDWSYSTVSGFQKPALDGALGSLRVIVSGKFKSRLTTFR
jgi:energy-coupling factor transporter ATP-binding protein EcfA2